MRYPVSTYKSEQHVTRVTSGWIERVTVRNSSLWTSVLPLWKKSSSPTESRMQKNKYPYDLNINNKKGCDYSPKLDKTKKANSGKPFKMWTDWSTVGLLKGVPRCPLKKPNFIINLYCQVPLRTTPKHSLESCFKHECDHHSGASL